MQLFMLPQLRSMSQLYTVFPEGNRRTEESCHDKRFQAFDVFGATAKKWCMPWTSAISVVFQKSFRIRYSIMAAARCVCVCVRVLSDIICKTVMSLLWSTLRAEEMQLDAVTVSQFSTQVLCMHWWNDLKQKNNRGTWDRNRRTARSDSSGCMLPLL